MLPRKLKRAANAISLAYQGIGVSKCRRCRTREARDRQCAADIRVIVAATEAGQTCYGILVKHLHVVTAKTGFDAFAVHLMVFPRTTTIPDKASGLIRVAAREDTNLTLSHLQ